MVDRNPQDARLDGPTDVLAAIVDSAPVAIVLCDADGRIALANREAATLFGHPQDTLRGQPVELLVPPAQRAEHPHWRAAYAAAPTVRPMGRGQVLHAMHSDGTSIPVEIALTPIPAAGGRSAYTLAIVLDLRERLRMQQALRDANEALERRVEERTAELQAALETNLRLIDDLQRKRILLERLSREDALTGLSNRRGFDLRLGEELQRVERLDGPLSVAMLDLDHFKRVNDHCGHAAGDEVLHRIGLLLRQQCRAIDVLGRYGGEEFAIAFPATPLHEAIACCERIRTAVERCDWHAIVPTIPAGVTISAGVAAWRPGLTARALLDAADANLYRAKDAGRNRVLPAPGSAARDG